MAKADGILNAVAHATHFGYSNHGPIQTPEVEVPNPALNIFVDLIADREHLERFCLDHKEILTRRVMVYKQLERWEL